MYSQVVVSSDLSRVALATDYLSSKGPLHILLKAIRVLSELGCSFMVKRVIRVWLQEQENQSHDHIADVKYGFPVGTEDIKTDVTIYIDIGMVDISVAVYNRCFMGILRRHTDSEVELSTNP